MLQKAVHAIALVGEGAAAIEAARTGQDVNSLEAARRIRRLRGAKAGVPAIAMTTKARGRRRPALPRARHERLHHQTDRRAQLLSAIARCSGRAN